MKDGKLSSPAMESTTKSNVLKVVRTSVFSNINYHSILYIRIVYKSKKLKFFSKFSVQVQVFYTVMGRAHKNLVSKVPKVTVNHIDLRKISTFR